MLIPDSEQFMQKLFLGSIELAYSPFKKINNINLKSKTTNFIFRK